jgi:hypothetical protein
MSLSSSLALLKNAEINDLQRDLKKMKRMQEETAKECSELKLSVAAIENERTVERSENITRSDHSPRGDTLEGSPEALRSSFLSDVSVTLHLTDNQVIRQMNQHIHLLESSFSSILRASAPETKTRQHKYLRAGLPLSKHKNEQEPLSSSFASSEQYLRTRSRWIEATSKLQRILLSVRQRRVVSSPRE